MASLIDNLKAWFGGGAAPAPKNTTYTLQEVLKGQIFGESLNLGGGLPALTERGALAVSAVYAAVNLIAGTIASLPVQVYSRAPDGERERLPSDNLWWVLIKVCFFLLLVDVVFVFIVVFFFFFA